MKQYRIQITDLAEMDLERAGDYIAYELKNPIAAKHMVRGIVLNRKNLVYKTSPSAHADGECVISA